jgi:phenylacetate-CoA ligase
MFAVPQSEVARVHASSGTTGRPTVVGYTKRDLADWAKLVARCLRASGVRPGMKVHNAYGYGLFTGGLGAHAGAEALGCTVIPMSGGQTERQIQLIQDFEPDAILATPTYLLTIADAMAHMGIDPASTSLKYAVLGAEPWTEEMRHELEVTMNIKACDIYGLSEIMGPGVAMECREGKGALHVFSDHFFPEIVDPAGDEPCEPGTQGELVLTTLTKQALPVMRFRTGDVTTFVAEPCACGRTFPRIARLSGRVDDMLVVRGVNVFPSEIEAVVLDDAELGAHYLIVLDTRRTLAELEVRAEVVSSGLLSRGKEIEGRAADALQRRLNLRTSVRVGPPGSLPRSEVGKARRVFVRDGEEDPAPFQTG